MKWGGGEQGNLSEMREREAQACGLGDSCLTVKAHDSLHSFGRLLCSLARSLSLFLWAAGIGQGDTVGPQDGAGPAYSSISSDTLHYSTDT